MNKNKVPVFKKGTCACESIGTSVNGSIISTRKFKSQNVKGKGNLYHKRESIKERFLK